MAEGSIAKKGHAFPPLLQGPTLLKGGRKGGGRTSLRNCSSVGSLNEKGPSGTIKVKAGGELSSSGSMANLQSTSTSISTPTSTSTPTSVSDKASILTSDNIGATVYISGVQSGILRYFGETQFKPGVWCGIELPKPEGNHDGLVGGVRYFKARQNCGIFAPVSKVTLKPDGNAIGGANRRWSLGPGRLSRENSFGSNGNVVEKVTPIPKGSKRPKAFLDNDRPYTTSVPKKNTSLMEQKKRRKLESDEEDKPPVTMVPNWNSDSLKYVTVRVPNFAEINEINLREEMEQSAASITPIHSSTPHVGSSSNSKQCPPDDNKVFPLEVSRRPSIIADSGNDRFVLTPPHRTESNRTFVIYSDQSRASRPTSLGLERGGSEEEELPSEGSSSDMGGLFGQKTPELWDGDGMSFAGLSSPEEAGIQEESSLGLQTPSQLFESWGELKDEELELYSHLRSPSIDNLDFEEEEDTHNALEEDDNDHLNMTVIPGPGCLQNEEQADNKSSSDENKVEETIPNPVVEPHHDTEAERCDSSVISASGYEPQTDSDFNTESEADHEELLLSHPTHTAPNKNRNARVIDGALYTSTTNPSTTSSQQSSSCVTTSTSEEPESSSSGFYSSSESGSLTRGSRHPSKGASGSDCDSSSNGSNENENEEVTLLHSNTDASSTITTERNSPEEAVPNLNVSLNSHDNDDTITIDDDEDDFDLLSKANKKLPHPTKKLCLDDSSIGSHVTRHGKTGVGPVEESVMNRSQSVNCLTFTNVMSNTNTKGKFLLSEVTNRKFGVGRKEKVTTPSSTTTTAITTTTSIASSKNTRVKGKHSSVLADTVASSSRRAAVTAKEGLGVGRLLTGSHRSLASSTSNLTTTSSRSPASSRKVTNKWDSVMAKINEGKGKQINVKEVRAKVFDRLQQQPPNGNNKNGNNNKGSTSNLVGGVGGVSVARKKGALRSDNENNKDAENEPLGTLTQQAGKNKGSVGGTVEGVTTKAGAASNNKRSGMLQRTDSTSSDCSDHQRQQFTTKHRPTKKENGPRRQISDVSTTSECSSSQQQFTKSKSKVLSVTTANLPLTPNAMLGHSTLTTTTTTTSAVSTNTVASRKGSRTNGTPVVKSPTRISPTSTKAKSKTTGSSNGTVKSVDAVSNTVVSNNKGSGSIVSTKHEVASSALNTTVVVKPLRDHNRISSITALHHPTSKSKEKEVSQSRSRGRRAEEKHLDSPSSSATLREQLALLKQQLDNVIVEDTAKGVELETLKTRNVEERCRRAKGLAECIRKVEAMAIVIQHTSVKNEYLTNAIETRNAQVSELEELLKLSLHKDEQVMVLKQQLESITGVHKEEITDLTSTHQEKIDELAEEHQQECDELREYYEQRLLDKDAAYEKEVENLKETHRLAMENYRAIHMNGSPNEMLMKDNASMSAVLEMTNERIKDLQTRNQILTLKEEELVRYENLVGTLSARVEDLEAQLNLNRDEKISMLAKVAEAEVALSEAIVKNKSLSQNVDELTWKLNNPDVIPVSPHAARFREESCDASKF